MSYHRYKIRWGNYKSDDHKSRKILKEEIRDILTLGKFSKAALKAIKETAKEKGFEKVAKEKAIEAYYNSRP